jgi:hypothetical protein
MTGAEVWLDDKAAGNAWMTGAKEGMGAAEMDAMLAGRPELLNWCGKGTYSVGFYYYAVDLCQNAPQNVSHSSWYIELNAPQRPLTQPHRPPSTVTLNGAGTGHAFSMRSALAIASGRGHTATVAALLDRGAEVDSASNVGSTPLHVAGQGGHTEAASLLLAYGASTSLVDCTGATARDEAGGRGKGGVVAAIDAAALQVSRRRKRRRKNFYAFWLI